MTDPTTYTAEFRSWEWEMVLRYEDGSLPATEWNQETLNTVATWYAKNLTREQATARYTENFHKNRRRLTHRRDGAHVATEAIEEMDGVWESILANAFERAK